MDVKRDRSDSDNGDDSSVFAGIMLVMAQEATPEDTDGVSNVVPGQDIERAYLRGDEIKMKWE